MRSFFCLFLVIVMLPVAGCFSFPWHPFGTPQSRAQKSEQQVNYIKADLLDLVQADVHRIVMSLQAAPASLQVHVAYGFAQHATTIMDQSRGAPTASEISKWQDTTNRLLSEDPKVQTAANKELEIEWARSNALSDKLDKAQTQHEHDQIKLAEYAASNEQLVNAWRWAKRIFIGLLVLWVSAQLLALAAKFYPPAAALSLAANGIMAPLHTIFHVVEARAKAAIIK